MWIADIECAKHKHQSTAPLTSNENFVYYLRSRFKNFEKLGFGTMWINSVGCLPFARTQTSNHNEKTEGEKNCKYHNADLMHLPNDRV